jgi:hypothetical protein
MVIQVGTSRGWLGRGGVVENFHLKISLYPPFPKGGIEAPLFAKVNIKAQLAG